MTLHSDNTSVRGFPSGSPVKNLPANAGDPGLISGLGRSLGEGNPFQYSCWKHPMDREAWKATLHGVTKSDMTLRLNHKLVL